MQENAKKQSKVGIMEKKESIDQNSSLIKESWEVNFCTEAGSPTYAEAVKQETTPTTPIKKLDSTNKLPTFGRDQYFRRIIQHPYANRNDPYKPILPDDTFAWNGPCGIRNGLKQSRGGKPSLQFKGNPKTSKTRKPRKTKAEKTRQRRSLVLDIEAQSMK